MGQTTSIMDALAVHVVMLKSAMIVEGCACCNAEKCNDC